VSIDLIVAGISIGIGLVNAGAVAGMYLHMVRPGIWCVPSGQKRTGRYGSMIRFEPAKPLFPSLFLFLKRSQQQNNHYDSWIGGLIISKKSTLEKSESFVTIFPSPYCLHEAAIRAS